MTDDDDEREFQKEERKLLYTFLKSAHTLAASQNKGPISLLLTLKEEHYDDFVNPTHTLVSKTTVPFPILATGDTHALHVRHRRKPSLSRIMHAPSCYVSTYIAFPIK